MKIAGQKPYPALLYLGGKPPACILTAEEKTFPTAKFGKKNDTPKQKPGLLSRIIYGFVAVALAVLGYLFSRLFSKPEGNPNIQGNAPESEIDLQTLARIQMTKAQSAREPLPN